jgi:hypothetical protein
MRRRQLMTKNTAEAKTAVDLIPIAEYLLNKIVSKGVSLKLNNRNRVEVEYTQEMLAKVASDLLDIYHQGWDDRSVAL